MTPPRPAVARRLLAPTALLTLALALAACTPSSPDDEPTTSPSAPSSGASSSGATSQAPTAAAPDVDALTYLAVGDSLTTGFASCQAVLECEDVSWALGTSAQVDSIASRLEAAEGSPVTRVSAAVVGAEMAAGTTLVDDALAQPGAPAAADVDLVTVMLGANDVCADTPAEMTDPAAFAASLTALLDHVVALAPDAVVVVTSIPAVTTVWDVASTDPAATDVWALGVCRTVLSGDAAAREQAGQRLAELQDVLATTCAAHAACRGDGGAVAATPVTAEWLSTVDHFHPSLAGQTALAAAAWPAVETAVAQR